MEPWKNLDPSESTMMGKHSTAMIMHGTMVTKFDEGIHVFFTYKSEYMSKNFRDYNVKV